MTFLLVWDGGAGAKAVPGERAAWEEELLRFLADWQDDTDAMVFQTSGSTGEPARLSFSKEAMRQSARRTLDYFGVAPGASALLCLPVRHVAGAMMAVRAQVGGLRLHVLPPDTDFRALTGGDIALAALVPLQVSKLLDSGQAGRIRQLLLGGAAVPEAARARLRDEFTGRAWETYGMTETLTHVAVRDAKAPAETTPFEGLPGVHFELDAEGCLVVYDPLRAEPVVTRDLAELVSPTAFHLRGRADFVINSGGVKIHPEEVERLLGRRLPGALCLGSRPDERLGERLVLILTQPVPGEALKEAFATLDPFCRPRETLVWPRLPQTPGGKLDRLEIRRRLAASPE